MHSHTSRIVMAIVFCMLLALLEVYKIHRQSFVGASLFNVPDIKQLDASWLSSCKLSIISCLFV